MNFYQQGAQSARHLFKVADILSTTIGRKLLSNMVQSAIDPEGKPRMLRTLEPYYNHYAKHDPEAFNKFDDHLRAQIVP